VTLIRRWKVVGVGLAASLVGLAPLASANLAGATGRASAAGGAANSATHGARPVLTPIGRPKPATVPPDFAPTATSPWVPLKHQPPFRPSTMLLASNGSVLAQSYSPTYGGTSAWYKLTPNAQGSYIDGTWSKVASMPGNYDPEYFASAILPTGRMIVEGGEYLGTTPAWTNKGAIYNPVTNTWKKVAPPTGWTNIGDAQSDVLADGSFLLSQACQNCTTSTPILTKDEAIFNATGLNWLTVPGQGKIDPNDEEAWSLEPDGQLLTVDTWLTPATQLFTPTSLSWSFAGDTVKSPVDTPAAEIGPATVLPGGNVFVVGAGTSRDIAPARCTTDKPAPTALYDYAAGKWMRGPDIPTLTGMQWDSADGPASILPDGNVLFDASPCVYNGPIVFYLYDTSSNSLTPVPDVPTAGTDSTYNTRLLALPNGQVLFDDGSRNMEVYTAGGTPNPAWAPAVTSISTTTLVPGKNASLSGIQLAGLSQGAAYGDDVQDNTNFPLVRITNTGSGAVTYARTFGWTSVSDAPGAASSTKFSVTATTPPGPSTLVVIANGIASRPVPVTIR
jgi:hypothetical protein